MPTGTGAANLRNLPLTKYAVNPGLFNQLTSRTIFAPGNFPLPAFGNYVTTQLLQVGIVAGIRVIVSGTITTTDTGAMAITPTAKWPWGLISRFTISGNGQNDFISCDGWDLHLRQLIQNRAMVDTVSNWPVTGDPVFIAAGSQTFVLQFYVPIAMDLTTLVGALYAQSEATNLTYRLQVETQANLFTITDATISIDATVFIEEEIFEVPYDPQHPDTLIIPDLTVLHGLVANENAVASQATLDTQLYRIQGQLERLFFRVFDPDTDEFTPTADYNFSQLLYGANQAPYTFNPQTMLQVRNNQDYRVALPDGMYVMDMVADNPARDQVLLEGVTNLRLRLSFANVPDDGSVVHFVQETLFA